MKQMFDLDLDTIQHFSNTRIIRTNSRIKNDEDGPISKIDDFQSSMSAFSTRIESKKYRFNSDNIKKKRKKKKNHSNKKVEFNPFITVVNIESFKKENYEGTFDAEQRCTEELFNNKNVKKCILCSIF